MTFMCVLNSLPEPREKLDPQTFDTKQHKRVTKVFYNESYISLLDKTVFFKADLSLSPTRRKDWLLFSHTRQVYYHQCIGLFTLIIVFVPLLENVCQ